LLRKVEERTKRNSFKRRQKRWEKKKNSLV
jgi:hypothetical protein